MKTGTTNAQGYMARTQLSFKLHSQTTYEQLLARYDPDLLQLIKAHNQNFLFQPVYIFTVRMVPEQLDWIIWKNQGEIEEFLMRLNDEMQEMGAHPKRMANGGREVYLKHKKLTDSHLMDADRIREFEELLNLLAMQPFLSKCEDFLLFIEHCMPTDKWNIKVYNQISVGKAPSVPNTVKKFVTKPCSGEEQNKTAADRDDLDRDYFLTITSDGILKSANHPMESIISSMIPFTNQLEGKASISPAPQSYLSFLLTSGNHEKVDVNFYKDYTNGVNFALGMRMALLENDYASQHRFESYALPRENCASVLYNDGVGYYEDLYQALIRANYQVCITGWMITPYFLLRRPNKITNRKERLDGVLQQLAERGVKVFIIVFQEPKMFVNNDSEHVEYYLMSLHRNITVLRHPNNIVPHIWSHHEKMVIIDQKIGFMGGLDICYGRWDTPDHLLVDPGQVWDGCEYNNYRLKDIYEPRNYKESNLNTSFQVRMPWHDIAIQYQGDIVLDLLRHFVQYWYYVKWDEQFTVGEFMEIMKQKVGVNSSSTQRIEVEATKDYLEKNERQIKERIHDKKEKLEQKRKMAEQERLDETIPELFIESRGGRKVGGERLQMCRSASPWSIGVREGKHEQSIHNAYQDLINNSRKHIYIENQFFMGLENKIVECLANRIIDAYMKKEMFRVVIVLPLLPGFEGDIADRTSSALRIQVYHQYNSIIRGENSLFKRLHQIPDVSEYVCFYGLRKAGKLTGIPTTEIIYVHSKLMIVDDCRAIIGSANINDRSLLGNRDSELACIIEEDKGNIFNLRVRLFDEHFALTPNETANHCSPQVWNKMKSQAKKNTQIYRKVFGCLPDDKITVANDIGKLAASARILQYDELCPQIVGHAVEYPMLFFKDEDLTFKMDQKEFFAPEGMFT